MGVDGVPMRHPAHIREVPHRQRQTSYLPDQTGPQQPNIAHYLCSRSPIEVVTVNSEFDNWHSICAVSVS